MKLHVSTAMLLCMLTLTAGAQTNPTAQPARPKTAGEAFKNVTTSTLRGLTVDDFIGAMGVMAAGLGFDCADCHRNAGFDTVNWADDSMPTKVAARKMIDMMTAFNRTNFAGVQVVTCWTCHHGREIPATSIALDHLYESPNDEKDDIISKDPNGAAPAMILDKYIAALGGAERLSRVTSFIATGKQNGGYAKVQGGGTVQIFAKFPDQRTLRVTFPEAPER